MKMIRTALITPLLACGSLAYAEGFEIKGYTLGAAMESCPAGTLERKQKGPVLYCSLGPTTLANQEVKSILISIFEGKLSSVMFNLAARGRNANSAVRDALVEKFGEPTGGRRHLGEYSWGRGSEALSFDGWSGLVLVFDRLVEERAKRQSTDANKKDM
jgi:hypothetical protein